MPRKRTTMPTEPVTAPFSPLLAPGWDEAPRLSTPAEVASTLGVDERTLRNWVSRGCPQAVGGARPRYELGKVNVWGMYHAHLHRQFLRYRRPMPARIEFREAEEWHLRGEYEVVPGPWSAYVLVPLAWDHPARAAALKVACAGTSPVPLDELAA
jgi:hypothetical protein